MSGRRVRKGPKVRGTGRRTGFALLLLLFLLLALTGIAHGVLVLSRRHLEISGLSVGILQSERAAEAGIAAAEERWWDSGGTRIEGEGVGELGRSVSYRWVVTATAPEIALVEAAGEAGGGPRWEAARVYWRADPDVRSASLDAVVTSEGGIEGDAAAVLAGPDEDGSGDGERGSACGPDTLPPLAPATSLPPDDAAAHGVLPSLGLLDGTALLERAERAGAGVRTSLPAQDPAVDEGGLAVRLSTTDLRIAAGARAEGLLLVGGDLILEPGAEVVGAVRVRGGVRLAEESRIVGDRCAVGSALREAPSLSIPLPVPGGSWIPIR